MYLRTALAQSIPNSTELRQRPKGEMAEWSIVAVSKAVELQGSGGSNPSLSAIKKGCKSAGYAICTLFYTQKYR